MFFMACLSLLSSFVQAQSLSQSDIDKYIKSYDLLTNSDDPKIKSLEESLKNNSDVKFDTDENGKFAVVTQMVKLLNDKQVDAITDVAEDAGFSSLGNWTQVADKVSAAMLAVEFAKEPMDTSQFSPEMLAGLPPEMRAQMEGVVRMIKAVKHVPAADISMVKKNYSKLERLMEN
jgi:hypothetical protein